LIQNQLRLIDNTWVAKANRVELNTRVMQATIFDPVFTKKNDVGQAVDYIPVIKSPAYFSAQFVCLAFGYYNYVSGGYYQAVTTANTVTLDIDTPVLEVRGNYQGVSLPVMSKNIFEFKTVQGESLETDRTVTCRTIP
jgi:hypothetical protein